MTTGFAAGEPAWIELSTDDPSAAVDFYADLFGWTVRDEDLDGGQYHICSLEGRDVAGIVDAELLHQNRSLGWLTYFATRDVHATIQRAGELHAATVVPPRLLPHAGTAAVAVDPFGAAFGLFQAGPRAGVQQLNRAGSLCWNELATGEPEQCLDFYRALFDFGTHREHSPTGRPYTVLTVDDLPVAGMLELESVWPNVVPARWLPYLGVDSAAQAAEQVTALGGTPTIGPLETPHGTLHVVRDPGGFALSLIELRADLRSAAVLPTDPGA